MLVELAEKVTLLDAIDISDVIQVAREKFGIDLVYLEDEAMIVAKPNTYDANQFDLPTDDDMARYVLNYYLIHQGDDSEIGMPIDYSVTNHAVKLEMLYFDLDDSYL